MDSTDLALTKFGIGQPVPRKEDPTLLRGEGRYTDDVKLAGQAHAVMVRSRIAHGTIGAIDADAARAMPGVLGVFAAADLAAAGYGPIKPAILIPNRDGSPMRAPLRPALPKDRVRFVGEAMAFVVAETPAQAKDAAEAVSIEIEPLPVVTTPAAALAPDAPRLHADAPGNVAVDYHYGDTAAVDAAFATAAHVTRLTLTSPSYAPR
jgi:aerobic carbon-monoxide dehydrogenase large subunit